MSRRKRAPLVYCALCNGSAHVNDSDPGCACDAGWRTHDIDDPRSQPCRLDGSPIEKLAK